MPREGGRPGERGARRAARALCRRDQLQRRVFCGASSITRANLCVPSRSGLIQSACSTIALTAAHLEPGALPCVSPCRNSSAIRSLTCSRERRGSHGLDSRSAAGRQAPPSSSCGARTSSDRIRVRALGADADPRRGRRHASRSAPRRRPRRLPQPAGRRSDTSRPSGTTKYAPTRGHVRAASIRHDE